MLGMDDEEFKGPTIQRVYQYLRRHAAGYNLDTFSYQDGVVEGDERDCLKIILRCILSYICRDMPILGGRW